MSFLTSTRVVRTALASAALLVLSSVAAPAAQAYNPDIDGDGIPNTWEMKGYDADGDGKVDVDYPGMGANPLKKDIFVEMVTPAAPSTTSAAATKWCTNSSTTP